MLKFIPFIIVGACAPVQYSKNLKIVPKKEFVIVHEMDQSCEAVPRFCLEQCQYGDPSLCVPQVEKMVVVYRQVH